MATSATSTAKSARRRAAATLLGVLALLVTAATVLGANGKSTFSIAAVPSSMTVAAGESVSYGVTVTRATGFTGTVALRVSGLPAGATAEWAPSASLVHPASSATLQIATSATTPSGKHRLTFTGRSGPQAQTASAVLDVQPPKPKETPDFTVAAAPAAQDVVQTDSTSYTAIVSRSGGFTGPVTLGVSGLPSGATASWSPSATVPSGMSNATLTVETAISTPPGNYKLTLTGTGTIAGGAVSRTATLSLAIQKATPFAISGDLAAPLHPGAEVPLDLRLSNPENFDLKVTRLTVAVADATSDPGCSGKDNFAVRQFSGAYPLTVPPGGPTALSALVPASQLPAVRMLNLDANQNACKGAALTLTYTGTATK